jgi:hypothetical protein
MATVNKDFRVKNGLVVEGSLSAEDGTISGSPIITADSITNGSQSGIEVTYTDGVVNFEVDAQSVYTDEAAQDAVASAIAAGTHENITITYDDENNAISFVVAESGIQDLTGFSTDDLDEGDSNLYFTEERSRSSISGGDGISYDSESGSVSVSYGYGLDVNEGGELVVDTVDIATKSYVDGLAEGLHIHQSVSVATTENISSLSSPPSAIDGVTLVGGMRVLVKDQTDKSENGIYVYSAGSLTRAEDYDTYEEIQAGDFVFVELGTGYGATGWVQLNSVNTLGSDDIEWTQFLGAGTVTGGNGISVDGQEVSLDFSEFDTDDISEGEDNLYYTDQRVINVLTNSAQTNISITADEGGLIITAENGVDDSTTDDLTEGTNNLYFTTERVEDVIETITTDDITEGTSNLYFTDQRAVDAIESVVPKFDAVEIKAALQVANSIVATTAETTYTAYSFDASEYRSGKFLVKMSAGNHTEVLEILLTLDTSNNIAITEYAIVGTNGSLGVVTATYSDGDVLLTVEPNNNNTAVSVYGTLLV